MGENLRIVAPLEENNHSLLVSNPLGHQILMPFVVQQVYWSLQRELRDAVMKPTFIIVKKNKALYFLRLINADLNLLVIALAKENYFVYEDYKANPSAEFLAGILEKATLISFRN